MLEKMTSYADNFEDVLLRRAFPDETEGFYIDVGAYDPVAHSVTKYFSERGWRGINVEPNPAVFERLRAGRPRDVNLNLGLSDHEGELTLYEAPAACWSVDPDLLTGWFGADRDELVERTIPVTTLARVCDEHVPPDATIHFLKVDVEGHEREVLAGADWSRWRPRVVLAEANRPETWEPLLLDSGYLFALFDGVNRFYVREEDRDLLPILAAPANAGDNFVINGYLEVIFNLQQKLASYEELGPNALGIARRLHRLSARYPKASSQLRQVIRRLVG
jgi:FkbM family methyltransferase